MDVRKDLQRAFDDGYNQAIDEFMEMAVRIVYESNSRNRNPYPRDMVADIHYKLLDVAEQMKKTETK